MNSRKKRRNRIIARKQQFEGVRIAHIETASDKALTAYMHMIEQHDIAVLRATSKSIK